MEKLAINDGEPLRKKPIPPNKPFDEKEEKAVVDVIRGNIISDYVGAYGPYFMGGNKVQELEKMYREHSGCKHAIVMNSATSVIIAAMGAFEIGPGDEVIVTSFSHVISATAPLLYDAIPVFADIEEDYYCLSVESIEKCITERTKAIIVVDLFGMSADIDAIMELANKHNIKVFSDAANVVRSTYKGKRSGSLAHMGCYSLNGHKVIQCGEGGIAVTNDDELALKMQLLRNHAENCVAGIDMENIINMIGYNFRMTELEAAVAIEQLKKSQYLVEHRQKLAAYLTEQLQEIDGLTPPAIREGCTHDFSIYVIRYDAGKIGIHRDEFCEMLEAEGMKCEDTSQWHVPPFYGKYVPPIHLMPIFTKKTFRPKGYPWTCEHYNGQVSYGMGTLPVVERIGKEEIICITALYPPLTTDDMDDFINAFKKIIRLCK